MEERARQTEARENPIGKFLGVTGPRNGAASAAAATSIPSERLAAAVGGDTGGSNVKGGHGMGVEFW